MARGRPQVALCRQRFLHEHLRNAVSHGRDPADREAGVPAHEFGVGLGDRLAEDARQLGEIDAAGARGHDEHRAVARRGAKHEGVGDLRDLAAEKVGGGLGGARRSRKLDDLGRHSGTLERRPHTLDARIGQDGGGRHSGEAREREARRLYNRPMELLAFLWDLVVHLDVHLGEFVKQHGVWVYGLLFVAGTLAALGEMNLFAVIATLIAAALCGDNSNYWIGRWAGMRLFGRWVNPVYLQRTHEFYERHGGKTIILARFVPIVRTYVPFVAGVGSMPYLRYLAFCVAERE